MLTLLMEPKRQRRRRKAANSLAANQIILESCCDLTDAFNTTNSNLNQASLQRTNQAALSSSSQPRLAPKQIEGERPRQHCKVRSAFCGVYWLKERGAIKLFSMFFLSLLVHLAAKGGLGQAAPNANQSLQQQLNGNSVIAGQSMAATASLTSTTSAKARYKTLYACEDRQLTMDCDFGSKINLIRANFGRFSITQCNEQGQLDLSTDCMSPITFRIMRERCQDKQKCSVNATSSIFGDKCPKTRKYLEVHFQCQPELTRPLISPLMFGEPEKVDLRNQSSIGQPSQGSGASAHHLGQHNQQPAIGLSTQGSSSILPPNNPTIPIHHHQQLSPQQIRPSTVPQNNLFSSSPAFEDQQVEVQQQQQQQQQQQFRQQQQQQQIPQPKTVMNSEIVSLPNNLLSSDASQVSGEPYIMTLRHTHTDNMSNPRCYSWDSIASQWTERGGRILATNMTHTTCAFEQATSYLLVMDHTAPIQSAPPSSISSSSSYPTISQSANPMLIQTNQQLPFANQPSLSQVGAPLPGLLENQPVVLLDQLQQLQPTTNSSMGSINRDSSNSSPIMRFFSLFGYLLALVFVACGFMTIAFIASAMRSSAGAALKSLGNFSAFTGGSKYKNRRADGTLPTKDLLVINNQHGHQFLYAPASTTKINSSSSTHILSSALTSGQHHQGTLHQIQQQQQQQQMYSGNGTLSNLSGTGAQSNNYYYGLMGLTNLFQQQQQQLQHHLSQHHLNQHQTVGHHQQTVIPASYHDQANKSTVSNESANSSSGVESSSTSVQHQQHHQQASCLVMNTDYSQMGQLTHYGKQTNLQQQPQLTMNAHYSSSGPNPLIGDGIGSRAMTNQHRLHNAAMGNLNNSLREHIYESVDEDKPYAARLLLPTNLANQEQFNSNTLSHLSSQQQQQQQMKPSRTFTLSSRQLQNVMQQQHQVQPNNQQQQPTNKRLFSHSAIVRDNQNAKTGIICSKLAQVTPQRATEINKFHHDVMAIYSGGTDTTSTTAANSSSSGHSSGCYSRQGEPQLANFSTGNSSSNNNNNKLSTDC